MNERATIVRRPATYQDVIDAPPNRVAELINGALYVHPRPASRHAWAGFRMAAKLDDPFQNGVGGPGGWYFAFEPELHLGPDVLVPDLCGWRRERMPSFPDAAGIDLAPDWVCELLSPGTRHLDLGEKRDLYADNGVGHLWLVDPKARTLDVLALHELAWVPIAAFERDAEVRAAPFDAIAFPLSALWPD